MGNTFGVLQGCLFLSVLHRDFSPVIWIEKNVALAFKKDILNAKAFV